MAAYDRVFETNQIGQLMDCSMRRVDSYTAFEDIEFGKLVAFTGIVEGQVEPRQANFGAIGVTVYDATKIEGEYKANTTISVLTFGRIMVEAFDNITQGNFAYAGINGQIRIAPIAPGDEFKVGVFLSNAAVGEKVLLEVRV